MIIIRSLPERRLFLFMRMLFSLYRYFNLLSLDVVAGSICCALFFSKVFDTTVERNTLVVLGMTVWLIYTTDHLLDASKLRGEAVTKRHYFHRRHFSVLVSLSLLVLIIDLVLAVGMAREILVRGIVAAVPVLLYLVFHSRLSFLKESVSAVLYCAGILIPVTPAAFNSFQILLLMQFFLVVLMNLILFAWFEVHEDMKQQSRSIATSLGKRNTGIIIWILFLVNTFIWSLSLTHSGSLIIWLMGSLHIVILIAPTLFGRNERYRLIGDAIFLLPVTYLLV